MRAVTSEEGDGPWSDIGEGQANRPPTASGAGLDDDTIAWKNSSIYDISDKFADADGDALIYSAESAFSGVLTVSVTGGKSSSGGHPGLGGTPPGDDPGTLRVTVLNPATATVTYAVSDAYGGQASLTFDVTGEANETRSVGENSACRHAGGRPGDRNPAWERDADLHAGGGCGGRLRHQLFHGADQRKRMAQPWTMRPRAPTRDR